MLLTEEQAEEKWCPFARVTAPEAEVQTSWNRMNGQAKTPVPATGAFCIGSACMAWRWKDDETQIWLSRYGEPDGEGWTAVVSDHDRKPTGWHRRNPSRRGFCGPAGRLE